MGRAQAPQLEAVRTAISGDRERVDACMTRTISYRD